MDYCVVVCSHKRIDTLRKKSLAVLQYYGVPLEKIFIFVAPDEVAAYQSAFPSYQVIPGALGLAANRNAVTAFFPPDKPLFCMDDDIKGYYVSKENKIKRLDNLDMMIRRGFEEAHQAGASLWGIFPVQNAKWMKNSITKGLTFCYGCTFGLFNKKDIQICSDFKEDFERCLKFYTRDKIIIRLNWVSPGQSYCKGKGGLSDTRSLDKEKQGCEELLALYPDLVTTKYRADGSRYDLSFRRTLYKAYPTDV